MLNFIYGTLLGDGCLHRHKDSKTPVLLISHSVRQIDYIYWKATVLGLSKTRIHDRISGKGAKMKHFGYYNKPILSEVYNTCINRKKKVVTKQWVDNLDLLSLAVWYQDDGSWKATGSKSKSGTRFKRRVEFFACDFSQASLKILCAWLASLGLRAYVARHKQYKVIRLPHSSSIKLWNMISPYMILKSKLDWGLMPGGKPWFNHSKFGQGV